MSDTELKDDANKVFVDVKAEITKLEAAEGKAVSAIKAHLVWIAFAFGVLLGFVAGRVTH